MRYVATPVMVGCIETATHSPSLDCKVAKPDYFVRGCFSQAERSNLISCARILNVGVAYNCLNMHNIAYCITHKCDRISHGPL